MGRLHQIHEQDLADLEQIMPQLIHRLYPQMDNQLRTQVRRLQKIIGDVRWNYGPPSEVESVPAEGD